MPMVWGKINIQERCTMHVLFLLTFIFLSIHTALLNGTRDLIPKVTFNRDGAACLSLAYNKGTGHYDLPHSDQKKNLYKVQTKDVFHSRDNHTIYADEAEYGITTFSPQLCTTLRKHYAQINRLIHPQIAFSGVIAPLAIKNKSSVALLIYKDGAYQALTQLSQYKPTSTHMYRLLNHKTVFAYGIYPENHKHDNATYNELRHCFQKKGFNFLRELPNYTIFQYGALAKTRVFTKDVPFIPTNQFKQKGNEKFRWVSLAAIQSLRGSQTSITDPETFATISIDPKTIAYLQHPDFPKAIG